MTEKEFEELSNVYRYRLVKSAINKWGDEGEDFVQEAFLRAFIDRDRWDQSCNFSTWIYGYVKIIAKDARRNEKLQYVDVDVLDLSEDSDSTFTSTFASQWIDSLTSAELNSVIAEGSRTSKHRAKGKWNE